MHLLHSLLALSSLAAAIQFTSPNTGSSFTKGSTINVSWTNVDTDPTSFSLYLWEFVAFPPYYAPLAFNVRTSAGSATVRLPCNIANSNGYQLSAINGTNVYVIYAQTNKFTIGGSACVDPTTSTSACPAVSTVTFCGTAGTSRITGNGTSSTPPRTTSIGTSVTVTPRPSVTPVTVSSGSYIGPVLGLALFVFGFVLHMLL